MTHLSETQLIDVLMQEPGHQQFQAHLTGCPQCRERLDKLKAGMMVARSAEPSVPLLFQPTIDHRTFDRRIRRTRLTWLAAAAVLLLGILGLRIEVGDSKLTLELALFSGSGAAEQKIQDLEQRLAIATRAIELQGSLVQDQIDARFNALYQDRQKDMEDFSVLLQQQMENSEIQNQRYFLAVRDQLLDELTKDNDKGTLQ